MMYYLFIVFIDDTCILMKEVTIVDIVEVLYYYCYIYCVA